MRAAVDNHLENVYNDGANSQSTDYNFDSKESESKPAVKWNH